MAPNFLSKLVRATSPTHTRDRSDRSVESSRTSMSPKPRSRAPSTTIPPVPPLPPPMPPPNGSADPKSSSRPDVGRIPTFITTAPDDGGDSDSTFPSVTVVPPSPLVGTTDLSPSSSNQSLPTSGNATSDRRNDGLPSVNGTTINSNSRTRTTSQSSSKSKHSINEDNLPTPTATKHPRSPKPNPPNPPTPQPQSRSRPVTPSSSAGNLREKASKQEQSPASPSMPPNQLDLPYEVRKQASNRSINRPPPPISISHARAATTPAPRTDLTDDQDGQAAVYTPVMPIVESPKSMRAPEYPTPPLTSVLTPANGIGSNSSLLSPAQRDSDSASIISTNTTSGNKDKDKDKKRPWRRTTAARKPTGLASAIAASGLAIANHSLTPAQQAQFTAAATAAQQIQQQNSQASSRKLSTSGSPPYTSSSNTSTSHIKSRSADLSPKSNRSTVSPRRTATSIHSDTNSEYYGDDRPEYYSGLEEGSSDEDGLGSDDDLMDLDLGEDDIPVTGFAVASNRRNADFHELFPSVPEGDYLIEDYGCALQREILIQGRLYISENHICFHANIFGWITDLSIPINEITHLEKKMTAFVIPNAIQITTRQAKYTFASFLSRDTTFDVVHNIWKLERPDDASISSGRGSYENPSMDQVVNGAAGVAVVQLKKATQCACGREGKHYTETALETVLPGTPDRIYNLIFASGFIKDFMAVNQKLLDIQISDWTPTAPDSKLLARNMSYIKPLNGSLGPKQTKCEIRDETAHIDFDDYVSTVTTTRTPDVPSGGVFSVKTRTCIMWASAMSTKVLVTTQVEWTGRSFIKGIIERSAIDGQKVYHGDLETAMRGYIKEHQSEFVPEGVDPAVITLAETKEKDVTATEAPGAGGEPTEEERKQRERERNQRGLQWAWDTFEGASQVARRSTRGALELIRDGWEQSSSTTILYFVIVGLVLSNMWTLIRMGSREEAGRRKERGKFEERERWVQGVVTALRDELSVAKAVKDVGGGQTLPLPLPLTHSGNLREEVGQLQKTLDAVEGRVQAIRESLRSVEGLNSQD